ncbi:hypothetical protein GOBAR_AA30534 [Gossypium barbadense]|uniref:Uncharacterized protein n=1 Tax=Gossypium barbadense TaxID=3634 RepID=A0A2P5WGD8_GOSBA|nr:hypothetical protein GOBAR_AA30534 [Gossypium barbadense]
MSRGELIIDDNQVKPASENLATEYQQQYNGGYKVQLMILRVMYYFETLKPFSVDLTIGPMSLVLKDCNKSVDDQWVNEFSKLHVDDWAEEFDRQAGEGALGDCSCDNWANSYDEGVYVFSDMNPDVGHQNPLKEGQELFRKGLLSEAVLALEAEVMKNPENAEGWRLLGITHAEIDDDQQWPEASVKSTRSKVAVFAWLLIADELNRGYFDDMSELKQHGARKFPAVDVIYSDGRKSKLPIVFDASGIDASKLAVPEASLVCLSFRANSQAMVDSWSKPFYDAFNSWLLCLNPIKRPLLRFMRKSSDGAKDALQRRIVYSFGDHYYFRKELKILNLLTGYIFLLDKFGIIRWQGFGLAKFLQPSKALGFPFWESESKVKKYPYASILSASLG